MKQQAQLALIEADTAFDLDQLQRRQERTERRQRLADFLDAIYAQDYGSEEKELFDRLWQEQQALWLQQLPSEHTRRSYTLSVSEFRAYLWQNHAVRHLWFVEPQHAIGWVDFMRTTGNSLREDPEPLGDRTINLRLAALSSFYEHMTQATKLVHGDQVGLFVSADGYPRQNPFRSNRVKRPKIVAYGNSRPIPRAASDYIINRLANMRNKALSHYRDHALLLTFYLTGYRADSVLSMQWGDFHMRTDGNGVNFDWSGKGGKQRRKSFPPRCWNLILAYLQADGRFHPGQIAPDDDMYIWQSLRRHGDLNLTVHRLVAKGHEYDEAVLLAKQQLAEKDPNRPIAQSTANDILRRHLRRYFEQDLRRDGMRKDDAKAEALRMAKTYHLHSLRHTFANALVEGGGDIQLASEALDHSSIETTRTYLESIRDPEDKTTALLEQAYGF